MSLSKLIQIMERPTKNSKNESVIIIILLISMIALY